MAEEKTDVLSLTLPELAEYLVSIGEQAFRARQLYTALYAGARSFSEITTFSKPLREKLGRLCEIRTPDIAEKQVSAADGTVKYLFRLADGECIESVLMKYKHGNSLCVSSEVGCPMGCAFCASTIGGKVRGLLPSEILGQIIAAQTDSGERVSNVVMMGIGEPLDNYENTLRFLRLAGSPDGLCIGYRHISLSTCGLCDRIYDLARENIPITLSVSLHAVTDEKRNALMPVNRRYNIAALMQACRDYFSATGRRISFEYSLIAGENDTEADARALAALMKENFSSKGEPVHVNLIPINPIAERGYRSDGGRARAFCEKLCALGVNATLRRRLGPDIDAACGQLRAKNGGN